MIVIVSLFFCMSTEIDANNNTDSYSIQIIDGVEYIVDSDGKWYSDFYTATGKKLTIEERLEVLRMDFAEDDLINNRNRAAIVPGVEPGSFSVTSYDLKHKGEPVKCTPDIEGYAEVNYGTSVTVTEGFFI